MTGPFTRSMCRSHFSRAKSKTTCSSGQLWTRRKKQRNRRTYGHETKAQFVAYPNRPPCGMTPSTWRYWGLALQQRRLTLAFRHSPVVCRRYSHQWKQPWSSQEAGEGLHGPLRHDGHGRSQPHPRHECYKKLRGGHVHHHAKILHPEHPRKVRDAGLKFRSHTGIWTRTIRGTAGR